MDQLLSRHKDIVISYAPLTPEMKVDELVYQACTSSSPAPSFSFSLSPATAAATAAETTSAQSATEEEEERGTSISLRMDFLPMTDAELRELKLLLRRLQRTNAKDHPAINQAMMMAAASTHQDPITVRQAVRLLLRSTPSAATAATATLHTDPLNNSPQQQQQMFMNFDYDESDMRVNQAFTMVLKLHHNEDFSSSSSSSTSNTKESFVAETSAPVVLTTRHTSCSSSLQRWAEYFARVSAVQWVSHQHEVYALNRWAKGVCQTGMRE